MKQSVKTIQIFLLLPIFLMSTHLFFAQENSIPENGNVGIGTTNPEANLQVNGTVIIDSSLVIHDSLTIDRSARVRENMTVDGETKLKDDALLEKDLEVQGSSRLRGNTIISSGFLELAYLRDSTLRDEELLLIDSLGQVKRGGDLKSLVYAEAVAELPCKDDNGGYTTPANPTWANGPGIIYTTRHCVPDVKVGIGTNKPKSKLHIKLNNETETPEINTHAIIVEQADGRKILQLTEDGLLQSREVKVDLESWADYVFDEGYVLMPLEDVKTFIQANGHLPNVPDACTLEQNGLELGKANVMLMEKVEELTLYMIQLQEQLKQQSALLNQQQQVIEQLQNQAKN